MYKKHARRLRPASSRTSELTDMDAKYMKTKSFHLTKPLLSTRNGTGTQNA
ncbi:hypothetical protein PAMC26577_24125 [Caballeronia sordidicola]|uniref:Uncharacterized protein n=1 Tax=Caballeronia sordidicola TaxID=196367 RepID=A0A242MJY9_CABSO|nr:hypothetical protein PAMC26577_24125 [Caballeronia sordidicola]